MKNKLFFVLLIGLGIVLVSFLTFVSAMSNPGIAKNSMYLGYSGYVLFFDDFNNNSTAKWMPVNGNWYINNSKYIQDIIEGGGGHWKYTKANFTGRAYNYEAEVSALTNITVGGCSLSGYIPGEYDPHGTQITISLFPRTQQVSLYITENGTTSEYIYYTPINLGQEYKLKTEIKNRQVSVFLDGIKIISDKPTNLTAGNFYLISDDTICQFDNVKISSIVQLTPEQGIWD